MKNILLLNKLKELLNIALESSGEERVNAIIEFQDSVWNDASIIDENINNILTDIAYLLDFYEPNKEWRKESPNYYGDNRLEELIKAKIQQIEECIKAQ